MPGLAARIVKHPARIPRDAPLLTRGDYPHPRRRFRPINVSLHVLILPVAADIQAEAREASPWGSRRWEASGERR